MPRINRDAIDAASLADPILEPASSARFGLGLVCVALGIDRLQVARIVGPAGGLWHDVIDLGCRPDPA